jgi:putative transposase
MYLTAKIKLILTPEQEKSLWQVSDSARRLYNLALEQRKLVYSHRKHGVSMFAQKRELTYLRKEYFSELHSQTAQEVVMDLNEAYVSFFKHFKTDNTARPPKFRGYKYFYTLTYPQSSFHLEDNAIVLHNADNWLELKFSEDYQDIPRVKKIKQAEICQYEGDYYVCISCEVVPLRQKTTGKEIAWDPGSVTLLTGYDGERIVEVDSKVLKKTAKYYDKMLDRIRSKIDNAKRGSKRHRRLMEVKKRTLKNRSRRMKQINHNISKELAELDYDAYYIGNWEKKGTLADTGIPIVDKRINRVVQNQLPVGILVGYLRYKANFKSKQVEKVNEARSTKTCSCCGHKGKKLDPSIRIFTCEKCGYTIGRDENAAINLYKWYAAPVTGPAPIKSRMSIKFVFGRHNKCLVQVSA